MYTEDQIKEEIRIADNLRQGSGWDNSTKLLIAVLISKVLIYCCAQIANAIRYTRVK